MHHVVDTLARIRSHVAHYLRGFRFDLLKVACGDVVFREDFSRKVLFFCRGDFCLNVLLDVFTGLSEDLDLDVWAGLDREATWGGLVVVCPNLLEGDWGRFLAVSTIFSAVLRDVAGDNISGVVGPPTIRPD